MWTHERLRPKLWKGKPTRYKQYKFNGHRFTVYKQKDGKLVGFERMIRTDLEMTVKRPDFVKYDFWKALENIPPMSSVDGELYVVKAKPGQKGNAGDAAHAIAECLPTLCFMPFAVPWWYGDSKEVSTLENAMYMLHEFTGLKLASHFDLLSSDTFEQLCDDARMLDIEGWVLKDSNYEGWWKVKPQKTIDCIVTGFKDGNGKYLGGVGALKVSAYINGRLVEIANVSGMSDDVRWDIDETDDLGRVCEVEYQDLGNGRRLIHAHFVQWRDDKPEDECTYDWEDL